MKFASLFTVLVTAASALGLTVNTPANVVACQPTQLSWSGGSAPYYLSIVPAGQISAPAIKEFPTQSGTSYTWNVDLQQGTSFTIVLKAGDGSAAYSDIVTVQPGTSTTCISSTVQETGGTSGSAAPAPAPTSGSSGSSPISSGSSSGSPSKVSSPASSSPAAHASNNNAASRLSTSASLGVVGVMGLIGAALF